MGRKKLGELLVDAGLIGEEDVTQALSAQYTGEPLGQTLVRERIITEQQLIEVLEFQLGVPHVNINSYPIDTELTKLVPAELAKRLIVMPMKLEGDELFIAMADPMDYFAIDEIRTTTNKQLIPAIASKDALQRAITQHYDTEDAIEEFEEMEEEEIDESEIVNEDSPVVRLVNQIITNAVIKSGSDIHVDPQEKDVKIRYRIDGIVFTERALPKHMQSVVIARLKIMANLNITENRIPQDGRIKVKIAGRPIDIRVSSLPTVFGEKVVMRILDFSDDLNHLDRLGFTDQNLDSFKKLIKQPNGIILITGPTGSGKSATLYAGLNELNSEEVNIITIEDPVEYQLAGINQVHVNDAVGMTFASGLRSILRQDPDIVMIGEIRDFETAQIAVRTSLTGHLVLSTLHTNSSVEALTRLTDMGVESFLISSSLSGVIAQRLIRRICRDCVETVEASETEKELYRRSRMTIDTVNRGRGCPSCNETGYRGRLAIHEVLTVDDKIRAMINKQAGTTELRDLLTAAGMHFLLEDGLIKVKQGLTTVEEVLRVASAE